MRAKAEKSVKSIPPIHLVMIYVCAGIIIFCLSLYFFAPADKAAEYAQITILLVGFVTGKLTNGFGKNFLGEDRQGLSADAESETSNVSDH